MISHKYKCIFIHIAKCAGTSIEHAFGVDVNNHKAEENNFLFGWDQKNKLWLQHATPQQLLDYGYINKDVWNEYYKFIVYRNSWDRAYSDYKWINEVRHINDSFSNFLNKKGMYRRVLNEDSISYYAGNHLCLQKDYFFIDGKRINYNSEIDFYKLENGFNKVIKDLELKENFFNYKLNKTEKNKASHYSYFYNYKRKKLVEKIYADDISFFDFKFEDNKSLIDKVISNFI